MPGREKTIGTCDFSPKMKKQVYSRYSKCFKMANLLTGLWFKYVGTLPMVTFTNVKLHLSGKTGIKSNFSRPG